MEITFIGGDELDGEVCTNDAIYGTARTWDGTWTKPSFLQQVTTSYNGVPERRVDELVVGGPLPAGAQRVLR